MIQELKVKKVFCIVAVIVATLGVAHGAEWKKGSSNNEATGEVDISSIKPVDTYTMFDKLKYKLGFGNPPVLKAWTQITTQPNSEWRNKDGVTSAKSLNLYDCGASKTKSLYGVIYKSNGEQINRKEDNEWSTVIPDSNGEEMFKLVCSGYLK